MNASISRRSFSRRAALFQQLRFAEHLNKHAADPSYTLRVHLQAIGRAIETWRLRRIMSALRPVDKKGAVLEGEGSVRPAGVETYEATV